MAAYSTEPYFWWNMFWSGAFLGKGVIIPLFSRNKNIHLHPFTWHTHAVKKSVQVCWFCSLWLFSKNIGYYLQCEQNEPLNLLISRAVQPSHSQLSELGGC